MTTVVAVKQGKKIHFAADSQATGGGMPFSVNKVYKVGKYAFAAAGTLSDVQATIRALERDVKKSKKKPSVERFVKNLSGKGGCYILAINKHLYEIGHDGSIIELGDGEPVGVGSGADFAIGALAAGADLETAVQIASVFDVYTGGDIVTLTV